MRLYRLWPTVGLTEEWREDVCTVGQVLSVDQRNSIIFIYCHQNTCTCIMCNRSLLKENHNKFVYYTVQAVILWQCNPTLPLIQLRRDQAFIQAKLFGGEQLLIIHELARCPFGRLM